MSYNDDKFYSDSFEKPATYTIPVNFSGFGKLFDGRIDFRNFLDIVIIDMLLFFLQSLFPLVFQIRLSVILALLLPATVLCFIGIDGNSVSEYFFLWLKFRKITKNATLGSKFDVNIKTSEESGYISNWQKLQTIFAKRAAKAKNQNIDEELFYELTDNDLEVEFLEEIPPAIVISTESGQKYNDDIFNVEIIDSDSENADEFNELIYFTNEIDGIEFLE